MYWPSWDHLNNDEITSAVYFCRLIVRLENYPDYLIYLTLQGADFTLILETFKRLQTLLHEFYFKNITSFRAEISPSILARIKCGIFLNVSRL